MKITAEWLKEKRACSNGVAWFNKYFPKGGEYQKVLDALAAENNVSWGQWLLQNAGRLNTTLELDNIESKASVFFAGQIIIKNRIVVAGYLLAGWGIEAGSGIEAGYGIEAGLLIACKLLTAKHRIFAGLCIWKIPTDEEKTITCKKLVSGEIAYGILREAGK